MADIIGMGFDEYVQKQVLKRQEKLRYGQTDLDVIRWNNTNNAFLRLTSGVNVSEDFVKNNLGLDPSTYKDSSLAKHFKLFAAQAYDKDNDKYSFTKGVGYNFQSSYGFADPTYTSYGLVPPPGLISANIKALNRGSLREATIQIQCNNLQQFQIIEALYLRLKYSILLEWGHSLYFNNDGELINSTHDLSDEFLSGKYNQTKVLSKIQEEKKVSDGNYDAFFGLVTNFEWTVRPDGGYDVTLIARAAGDVIESLKLNTNSSFDSNVAPILGTSGSASTLLERDRYKTTLNRILSAIALNVVPGYETSSPPLQDYAHGITDANLSFALNNNKLSSTTGLTPAKYQTFVDNGKYNNLLTGYEAKTWTFQKLSEGYWNNQHYIKLGALLRIIDSFLTIYNDQDNDDPLFKIDYNFTNNFCFTIPGHASVDPKVCLIPINTENSANALKAGKVFYEDTTYAYSVYSGPGGQVLEKALQSKSIPYNLVQSLDLGFVGLGTVQNVSVTLDSSTSILNEWKGTVDSSNNAIIDKVPNDPSLITLLQQFYTNGNISSFASTVSDINNAFTNNQINTNVTSILGDSYITNPSSKASTEYYKFKYLRNDTTGAIVSSEIIEGPSSTLYSASRSTFRNNNNDVITETIGNVTKNTFTIFTRKFSNTNASAVLSNQTDGVYIDLKKANDEIIIEENKTSKKVGFVDFTKENNYTARTMHIHVNMEYVCKVLADNYNIKTGELNLYKFLEKLMNGIQNALGNINSFEVIYKEDTNTFKIIDNTFIPGQFESGDQTQKTIVEFLISANGEQGTKGGSFVKNINFRTKLSNAFATMTTIGAQKNGAVVGSDATALSKWNTGLEDRIIKTKTNPNGKFTDSTTEETIDNTFIINVNALQTLINLTNDHDISDEDINKLKNSISDLYKAKISSAVLKDKYPGIGFIPFDLEINMMGLSGPRIYESYTIDTKLLPQSYQNAIQFICSGVSHNISNGEWTTTLNSICGPKQKGITVKGMNKLNLLQVKSTAKGSSAKQLENDYSSLCPSIGNNTQPNPLSSDIISKAKVVKTELQKLGLSDAATYGLIGCLIAESGINYQAWNIGKTNISTGNTVINAGSGKGDKLDSSNPLKLTYKGNPITAYGIAQWTQKRKEEYYNSWTKGGTIDNLENQAKYMAHELNGAYKTTVLDKLKAIDINDPCAILRATMVALYLYEGVPNASLVTTRYKNALGLKGKI